MIRKILSAIVLDGWTKLFALVVALCVWYYAHSRLETTEIHQANIILRLPAQHVQLFQSIRNFRLRIRGPGPLNKRIGDVPVVLTVPADDIKDSQYTFDIARDFGRLRVEIPPRDLVQLDVEPMPPADGESLVLNAVISPLVRKEVKVAVKVEGEPRYGYRLADLKATPPRVNIEGPKLVLDRLEAIDTLPLVIWNVNANQTRTIGLMKDRQVQLPSGATVRQSLRVEPESVTVALTVEQEEIERVFNDVKFVCWVPGGFPFAYTIRESPFKVTARIRGRRALIQAIQDEQVMAYVDLSSFSRETIEAGKSQPYKETVKLAFPNQAQVSGWRVEPESVTILLKNPQKGVE